MARITFILLATALFVALTFADKEHDDLLKFKQFVITHKKTYSNAEFPTRLAIFKDNLVKIERLNAQSRLAKFGVNKFADLSTDEFKSLYMGTKPFKNNPSWPMLPTLSEQQLKDTPISWDWRDHGAVTPVKDQGQCGSCWSFSTTGNVEGQWFLAGNSLVSLSEQNLVDCDHECMIYEGEQSCDSGCEGGLMPNAFTYIMSNNGIDTEDSYPYLGVDSTCNFKTQNVGAKISNWTMIPGDEKQMASYLAQIGPLSIAVDATWWQFYLGGVFDFPWCGDSLDHGVLIVGYGNQTDIVDEDVNYWLIKNSWSDSWGESGYIKVYRGDDQCGINLFPCSSLIKKQD
jgi:cathepsin F